MASDLICKLKQLYWVHVPSEKNIFIYVIDHIFYEIHLNKKFEEAFEALNEFLDYAG